VKKLLVAAVLAGMLLAAGAAKAGLISQAVFTIVIPGTTDPWTFFAGIDDQATDGFDSGVDAVEPPPSPFAEIRMHSFVSGAPGNLKMDYRPGNDVIDGFPGEIWPEVYVDGYNLNPRQTYTGVITWDLSQANGWLYYLIDYDAGGLVIDLQQQSEYEFTVSGGFGPWLGVEATLIPEPGTIALLLTGVAGLAGFARRKR